MSSSSEIGLNWFKRETGAGQSAIVVLRGDILALISATLFAKKARNESQSLLENIGTGGGEGLTNLLIVANRVLGLFLLE